MTISNKLILLSVGFFITANLCIAQIQTGVWRTDQGNTNFHHLTRNGIGSVLYINQESTNSNDAILRLSSGSFNANQNVRVTFENNGNVGIGTITPDSKLSVNGNIRAREIKLETTNWPDYVFYEDYDLMSLKETKGFIKKNGHLPGFQPAEEYETNGVEIMKLNRQLVKKVEEMTLHLIQQEEVITKQENKLTAQERNIQRLEERLEAMEKVLREEND